MLKRRFKSVQIVVLLAALLVLSSSAFAQEGERAADQVGGEVATRVFTPARQRAALNLWTRELIAAAAPLDLPTQAGPAAIDAAVPAQPEAAVGPAGFAASGAPAPDADAVARAAFPLDWAIVDESASALAEAPSTIEVAGTSQVYTSYIVNQVSAMQTLLPHRWVGRISFTTSTGPSFCSGTSISGNVMVTAAHCLYDTTANRWYTNIVFAPAYRNGSAPYGTFAARQCWVLSSWINLSGSYDLNAWAQHDVGVCKMSPNSAGTTLNNAVGWMGRQWNAPFNRHFHVMGYPFYDYTNTPLSNAGLYLRTCVAESFQQTTETRGLGCNHGGGISGGPWIVGYAPGVAAGSVDGVNSGLFFGAQNMYGARFNSNNIVPLCNVAVC
jgi:V8-like Glu-specific endopeptidase